MVRFLAFSNCAKGCEGQTSMGELTAHQVGISNCKTWYGNESQVSYETWPQTRSCSYQVLQSSFLENSGNPNLSG